MANMTVNERALYDRPDLAVPTTGVGLRSRRGLAIYTALATLVLAALSYAAIEAINGWAQVVVLAMIFVTAIGVMIALDPRRRGM